MRNLARVLAALMLAVTCAACGEQITFACQATQMESLYCDD